MFFYILQRPPLPPFYRQKWSTAELNKMVYRGEVAVELLLDICIEWTVGACLRYRISPA